MFLLYHYYRVGGPPNIHPSLPTVKWYTRGEALKVSPLPSRDATPDSSWVLCSDAHVRPGPTGIYTNHPQA